MNLRKFTVTILISLLVAVPILGQLSFNVYADTQTATRDQVKEAFKAYCISRNVLVNGSVLGSAATWLGGTMDNIIDTLGIDMDYLQSQISVQVGGNLGVRYILNTSAVPLFNRIFAELLQREDLEVGDTDVDKKVYSGIYYTDPDGYKSLVWVFPTLSNQSLSNLKPIYYGDQYKYTSSQLYQFYLNGETPVYHFGVNQSDNARLYKYSDQYYDIYQFSTLTTLISDQFRNERLDGGNVNAKGSRIIGMVQGSNTLYFGSCCYFWDLVNPSYPDTYYAWGLHVAINTASDSQEPTDVTVTTPDDDPIKPAPPDDKPITIDPDGNTDHDPDNPDNPDNPIIPPDDPDAPTGGTPPDWGTDTEVEPDGDGWKIPFTLPDLDIDWSIDGLGSKFPFCIPRDLVALVGVLNVEPVAPSFTGTVDLFIYDWDIDIDFTDFEAIGVIVRNGLFILFCVGLLIATRSIIRG